MNPPVPRAEVLAIDTAPAYHCGDGGATKGRDHSPNAKGNFCFDRVTPLDRSQVVLDLRLKR
jgi:hypothetical protein